jgi:hypothetical protein
MNVGQIIVWIIVGGFAGTLAGRAVTFKKRRLGKVDEFPGRHDRRSDRRRVVQAVQNQLWVRRAEGHLRGSYRRFHRFPASDSPLADGRKIESKKRGESASQVLSGGEGSCPKGAAGVGPGFHP